MGVLLGIRWPESGPTYAPKTLSNVNLFRHIFTYLSGNKKILKAKVHDHGYLRTRTDAVVKVMDDGKLLKQFEKIYNNREEWDLLTNEH